MFILNIFQQMYLSFEYFLKVFFYESFDYYKTRWTNQNNMTKLEICCRDYHQFIDFLPFSSFI